MAGQVCRWITVKVSTTDIAPHDNFTSKLRSAEVWHTLSMDHTVLPAQQHSAHLSAGATVVIKCDT